ncbi:MAG: Ubiquinone biosynthesis O-methyltransferase [bacterium]|nr:Ubiquinone biosynthesis O-methyltransferase [bacterium]
MMSDTPALAFTGERLVPGQVDQGLLAEHVARYQWALSILGEVLPPAASVLDVACGAGYGTHMLAQAGFTAQGVDISKEAISWAEATFGPARQQGLRLSYTESDVSQLPLNDGSVSGIVAFEILEHLTDPAPLLREISRVLAPGGIALISTPNPESHQIAGENEFHHHEYTPDEFRQLLTAHLPEWTWTLSGQVGQHPGSSLLTSLRKGYIGLKRKLGIGALVKKRVAEWTPAMDLRQMPTPYKFVPDHLHGVEYLVARLQKPGAQC